MSYHCPNCQRMIFNRRLVRCGFCGADMPASLRFTAEEIAIRDRKMAESEARRKRREIEQEEEEARRAREQSSANDSPIIM
jgi:uncharacterized Zn finger protein (UPF0148 family)